MRWRNCYITGEVDMSWLAKSGQGIRSILRLSNANVRVTLAISFGAIAGALSRYYLTLGFNPTLSLWGKAIAERFSAIYFQVFGYKFWLLLGNNASKLELTKVTITSFDFYFPKVTKQG